MQHRPRSPLALDLAERVNLQLRRCGGVARLLEEQLEHLEHWRSCATCSPGTYRRNLLSLDGLSELLLLGWGEGSGSPVHDHAGQRCWMVVLDGEVEEVQLRTPHPREAPGPLEVLRRRRLQPGQVAYLTDALALHQVRPVPGQTALTLHVYSRPILTCQVYDTETGQVRPHQLTYHTLEGEAVPEAPGQTTHAHGP